MHASIAFEHHVINRQFRTNMSMTIIATDDMARSRGRDFLVEFKCMHFENLVKYQTFNIFGEKIAPSAKILANELCEIELSRLSQALGELETFRIIFIAN